MFKVGDKVVCVDVSCLYEELTLGRCYAVLDINPDTDMVQVKGDDGVECFFYGYRFKLESELEEFDPLVEIRQSEYDSLIEEINLLQELLMEANARNQSIPEFKPVSEYTMSDWEQALNEKWEFEQRDGSVTNIISLDYSDDISYPVETESTWLRLDGTECDYEASDSDIVERIK